MEIGDVCVCVYEGGGGGPEKKRAEVIREDMRARVEQTNMRG